MKILRHVFCKLWGFIDEQHARDFCKWDDQYRIERVAKRIRGNAQVANSSEPNIKKDDQ